MDPKYRFEIGKSIAYAVVALAVPFAPSVWLGLSVKGASVWNMSPRGLGVSFVESFGPLPPLVAVAAAAGWLVVWPRKLRRLNEGRLSVGANFLRGLLWILLVLDTLGLAVSLLFFLVMIGV